MFATLLRVAVRIVALAILAVVTYAAAARLDELEERIRELDPA
jgi:hypothetical protein